MNPMQAPRRQAPGDAVLADSRRPELQDADDAMLAPGDPGDLQVGTGALLGYTTSKAPSVGISPLISPLLVLFTPVPASAHT